MQFMSIFISFQRWARIYILRSISQQKEMGANPDQEPKQPTWQIDVVLRDHTISFATGPDGAGRTSEDVHWRGDPESGQYDLSDTGIVAAAGQICK